MPYLLIWTTKVHHQVKVKGFTICKLPRLLLLSEHHGWSWKLLGASSSLFRRSEPKQLRLGGWGAVVNGTPMWIEVIREHNPTNLHPIIINDWIDSAWENPCLPQNYPKLRGFHYSAIHFYSASVKILLVQHIAPQGSMQMLPITEARGVHEVHGPAAGSKSRTANKSRVRQMVFSNLPGYRHYVVHKCALFWNLYKSLSLPVHVQMQKQTVFHTVYHALVTNRSLINMARMKKNILHAQSSYPPWLEPVSSSWTFDRFRVMNTWPQWLLLWLNVQLMLTAIPSQMEWIPSKKISQPLLPAICTTWKVDGTSWTILER